MSPSTRSVSPMLPGWRRIPGPPRDAVKARLLRLHRALLTPSALRAGGGAHALRDRGGRHPDAAHGLEKRRARRSGAPTAGSAHARRLAALGEDEVAALIRSAGTYRLKAQAARLTRWLLDRCGGRFQPLRRAPLAALRRDLLRCPDWGQRRSMPSSCTRQDGRCSSPTRTRAAFSPGIG